MKPEWLSGVKNEMKHLKMDGVPNIIRSERSLVKFMWAAILLLSGGVCIFLIIGSIHEYQSYEVISTSRIVQEEESIFPMITICNNNPFPPTTASSWSKKPTWTFRPIRDASFCSWRAISKTPQVHTCPIRLRENWATWIRFYFIARLTILNAIQVILSGSGIHTSTAATVSTPVSTRMAWEQIFGRAR